MAFIDDIQSRDTALTPIIDFKVQKLPSRVNTIEVWTVDIALMSWESQLISMKISLGDGHWGWREGQAGITRISRGDYLVIDGEYLYVTDVNLNTRFWNAPAGIITVERDGLFPDTHYMGAPVFKVVDKINYFISTKNTTISNRPYDPLLTSSPAIKESIDLENRKYKISNVSLKISNIEYDGFRFSDAKIPLNTNVSIYWTSPSCNSIEDCYLAYNGTVRGITHNDKICNITLEDVSQSTFHRDVPVNLISTGDESMEKYKNKPIPMVYGEVDKSPVVLYSPSTSLDDNLGTSLYAFVDSVDFFDNTISIQGIVQNEVPLGSQEGLTSELYINRNGMYYSILSNLRYELGLAYKNQTQYTVLDNNTIKFEYTPMSDGASPLGYNSVQVYITQKGHDLKIYGSDDAYSLDDTDIGGHTYTWNYGWVNFGDEAYSETGDWYNDVTNVGISYHDYVYTVTRIQYSYQFDGLSDIVSDECKEILKWDNTFDGKAENNWTRGVHYIYETAQGTSGEGKYFLPEIDNNVWETYSNTAPMPSDLEAPFSMSDVQGRTYNMRWTVHTEDHEVFLSRNADSPLMQVPVLHRVYEMGEFLESDIYANVKGRVEEE